MSGNDCICFLTKRPNLLLKTSKKVKLKWNESFRFIIDYRKLLKNQQIEVMSEVASQTSLPTV